MFRDELDALNAIHQEQQKTNELLEKLVSVQPQPQPKPKPEPESKPTPEMKKQDGEPIQGKEGAVHATKGRSGGNRGKGA